MASFRFVHCADIHLDSAPSGIAPYDGLEFAPFRHPTRRALTALVEAAIEAEARFVLIAGDLFDGDLDDLNTLRFLRDRLRELDRRGVRTFIVRGNHDAQSRMRRALEQGIELPDGARILATRPETVELEDLGVAIHGQSFARRKVTENLAGGFPAARPGLFNIGLLHTSCGEYESHDTYAPSTLDDLLSKGYDYWALGHIHQRQELHRGEPWVVYPGNLQARHIREEGAKGFTLVTVRDGVATAEHRPVDVLRWARVPVDVSRCEDLDDVLEELLTAIGAAREEADGRALSVRVELRGATEAHRAIVAREEATRDRARRRAEETWGEEVHIETVRAATRPRTDLASALDRDDPLGGLLRGLLASDDVTVFAEETEALRKLMKKLPSGGSRGAAPLDLDAPGALAPLLEEARELLLARLLEEEGDS